MANTPIQVTNSLLANASANLGSAVPASTKYLLKEVHLYNSGAGVNTVKIRVVGSDADTYNIVHEAMAAGATLNLPFNMVLNAADQIKGFATTASEVHVMISAVSVT